MKAAALDMGLPITDDLASVTGVGAELGIVVAYGRIIPRSVLGLLDMVNLHFSLLPRWRGAAPVERAILAGDDRTGACVMEVREGLDTGAVHASFEVPIDDEITAADLTAMLAGRGADLVVDALAAGLDHPTPQPGLGVTYAHKITVEDRHLDWTRPAEELRRIVRIGGAWSTFRSGRFKVIHVEPAQPGGDPAMRAPGTIADGVVTCGAGTALRLRTVQPEGRAPMEATAWANGAHPDGEQFDCGSGRATGQHD